MYGVDVQNVAIVFVIVVVNCVNFKRFRFVGTYIYFIRFAVSICPHSTFIIFIIYFVYYSQNRVVLFANVLSHNAFEEFSILVDCCGISDTVCNNELGYFEFCK